MTGKLETESGETAGPEAPRYIVKAVDFSILFFKYYQPRYQTRRLRPVFPGFFTSGEHARYTNRLLSARGRSRPASQSRQRCMGPWLLPLSTQVGGRPLREPLPGHFSGGPDEVYHLDFGRYATRVAANPMGR